MRRHLALFLAAVSYAPSAFAAWSSSGGGEVFTDELNPWFVQNTDHVTWCTLIDEATFGLTEAVAAEQVQKAFDYWRGEFARVNPRPSVTRVQVATQTFTKIDCGSEDPARSVADVTIQFGVLTTAQRDFLKQPTSYVGAAIRTDYDRGSLRGKGFVYIAPVRGADRPRIAQMMDNPWEVAGSKLLRFVLMHEIGHLFGIVHRGSGESFLALMGQRFPEDAIKQGSGDMLTSDLVGDPDFFSFSRTPTFSGGCPNGGVDSDRRTFYGLPPGMACYVLRFRDGGFDLYAAPEDGEMRMFGRGEFSSRGLHGGFEGPIAYQIDEHGVAKGLLGPFGKEEEAVAVYRPLGGGEERTLYFTLKPNGYTASAFHNGRFVPSFEFGSSFWSGSPSAR